MDVDGARTLVCGASGALGGALTDGLHERGARVVAAGRDRERLQSVAQRTGNEPVALDLVDPASCRAAVDSAAAMLSGLDLLVVASGVAAFGPAAEEDDAVVEELFSVNVLGPTALVRAAAPHLGESGGAAVVLSAILADMPTNQMAAYSATKSALSTWLEVLRREERQRFRVLDVRPPHLDTGLESRALAGEPPSSLPDPQPAGDVVTAILTGIEQDHRLLTWDPKQGTLTGR